MKQKILIYAIAPISNCLVTGKRLKVIRRISWPLVDSHFHFLKTKRKIIKMRRIFLKVRWVVLRRGEKCNPEKKIAETRREESAGADPPHASRWLRRENKNRERHLKANKTKTAWCSVKKRPRELINRSTLFEPISRFIELTLIKCRY